MDHVFVKYVYGQWEAWRELDGVPYMMTAAPTLELAIAWASNSIGRPLRIELVPA